VIKSLQNKTVLLKAGKVDVAIRYISGYKGHNCTLHPRCEKIVEATLKDVIGRKSTKGVSSTAAATESAEKTVASEETGTKESPIVLTWMRRRNNGWCDSSVKPQIEENRSWKWAKMET
jgi:hypothetical protein